MNYLNPSNLDNDPAFASWVEQAQSAMLSGADPLKVNAKLRTMMADRGYDPNTVHAPITTTGDDKDPEYQKVKDYWETPFVTKDVKNSYRDSVVPEVVHDLTRTDNSPDPLLAGRIEAGGKSVNPKGFLDSVNAAGDSAFARGASGLADVAGSLVNVLDPSDSMDAGGGLLNWAAETKHNQDKIDAQNASNVYNKAGSLIGSISGGLASGGIGDAAAAPRQDLEDGMSPAQAWADTTIKGVTTAGEFAAPVVGKELKVLGHSLVGGLGTGVIGTLGDVAHNAISDDNHQVDPFDATNRLLGIGLGAIAGAGVGVHGRIEAKIRANEAAKLRASEDLNKIDGTDLPSTGDATVDSGVKAYNDFGNKAPAQEDLLSKVADQEQPDLFGAEPVKASTAEARRIEGLAPHERTPEEQASLEKNYIFDMQDKLNKQTPATDELPSTADMWDVGVPPNPQPAEASIQMDETGTTPAGYTESAPNDAMRSAFQEAGLRRASGMRDSNLYPDTAHNTPEPIPAQEPKTFEPSSNPTIEQTAIQSELPLEPQGDLFNQQPGVLQRQPGARGRIEAKIQANKAAQDGVATTEDTPAPITKEDIATQRAAASEDSGMLDSQFDHDTGPFENNASGESDASLEAINRHADEQAAGQHRMLINKDGTVVPLVTADAVDAKAGSGQIIVQRGIGRNEWTPLSQGHDVPNGLVEGRINAARSNLDAAVAGRNLDMFARKGLSESPFYSSKNVPQSWIKGLRDGTLSFKDILNDVIHNKNSNWHPQIQEFAKAIRDLGDKLGGTDVKYKLFDNNDPEHAAYMAKKAAEGKAPPDAYYNPRTHTVHMSPDNPTPHAFLHEGTHAVTSRAIEAGLAGKLTGPAREAFTRLQALFEETKSHAIERASKDPYARQFQTYGLKNMHEFVAELFTSPAFRAHLRSIPMDEVAARATDNRTHIGKIRNMYQGVVSTIRHMLGMAPKADSVVDAAISSSHDFFNKVDVRDAPRSRTNLASESPTSLSKWFRASKVVDEKGDPKMLYHGTSKDKDFTAFNMKDRGVWLTDNPADASSYANDNESRGFTQDGWNLIPKNTADRVIPVYARIENPYKWTSKDTARTNVQGYARAQAALFREIRAAGHDGIDMGDGTWVALESPNQLKSAIGNNGNFSASNKMHESPTSTMSPDLRRPRGKVESKIRELLLSKGNNPLVHDVAERTKNEQNVAALKSSALINVWNKNKANIDVADVGHVLESTDQMRPAFARIKAQSPELAQALNDWRQGRHEGSLAIVDEINRNPNATPSELGIAKKVLDNHNTYLTRSYGVNEVKGFSQNVFDSAAKGNKDAQSTIDAAKNYLRARWLPGIDNLNKRSVGELKQLWEQHVGTSPDQALATTPKDQIKARLIAGVADKLNSIVNHGQWLDNAVRAAAGLTKDDASTIAAYYKGVRQGSDVLTTLDKIPASLAKLWGETTHPILRAAKTTYRQASTYAQLKAQNDLREAGLADGTLTTKSDTPTHTIPLRGEQYGSLQGLYTTPHTADAINSHQLFARSMDDLLHSTMADTSGRGTARALASGVANVWMRAARLNKAATILGNVGNPIMDLLGSPLELASNGNINPLTYGRGFAAAMRDVLPEMRAKLHPDNEILRRYGVSDVNPVGDLRQGPIAAEHMKALSMIEGTPNPIQALKQLADAGKIPMRIYTDLYGATHSWAKYANFFNEASFLEKLNARNGGKLTQDQIYAEAADRINSTNISMNRAPKLIRALDAGGATLLGKYVQQTLVNPLNNVFKVGAKDLFKGIQSGDALQATHGLKRIAGSVSYIAYGNAMYAKIATALAGTVGLVAAKLEDNDPRKKYIDKDEFLSSGDQMIVTDPSHPASGEITLNIDRPNPFGPAVQATQRLFQAVAKMQGGDKNGAKEQAGIAVRDVAEMFSANSLFSKLTRIATGQKPSMASTNPDRYKNELDWLSDYVNPATADKLITAQSIAEPSTVGKISASSQVDSPKLAAMIASGTGTRQFNAGKDIEHYLGHKFNTDLKDAQAPYMSYLMKPIPAKADKIEAALKEGMHNLVEPYDKMVAAVAAAKAQGLSEREIQMRLTGSGMDKEAAHMVYNNKPVPINMILGKPKSQFTTLIKAESNPDKQAVLIQQARDKMAILTALHEKYKDVTMDELRNE